MIIVKYLLSNMDFQARSNKDTIKAIIEIIVFNIHSGNISQGFG